MSKGLVRVWLKTLPKSFWTDDGAPKRCTSCGGKNLSDKTTNIDANHVSEYRVCCDDCKAFVQEWAYGHYNYNNTEPEPWWSVIRGLFK